MILSLILAAPEATYELYRKRCERTICVEDQFIEKIKSRPTPLFDALIDEVNLNSPRTKQFILSRLPQILANEALSKTQLNLLCELLAQLALPQLKELTELKNLLETSAEKRKEFIFLFKEKIPLQEIKNNKFPGYRLVYRPQETHKIPEPKIMPSFESRLAKFHRP